MFLKEVLHAHKGCIYFIKSIDILFFTDARHFVYWVDIRAGLMNWFLIGILRLFEQFTEVWSFA